MTFLRVTRDQRGYETTFLLHSPRPGERPRVLYWYRTAPGVRVGRRALDEDAIRAIEEQNPEIEFDWPQLLEEAESVPAEVERRPERPRRRPQRLADSEAAEPRRDLGAAEPAVAREQSSASVSVTSPTTSVPTASSPPNAPGAPSASTFARQDEHGEPRRDLAEAASGRAGGPGAPRNALLDQLVGREIASRLRARYDEVARRLEQLPDDEARRAWRARADALDPDRWTTPDAILRGVENAERLFDELKRDVAIE